uniref:Oocyst wall protein n=1 Tax=Chromera velia CCMP2878 TaxID=1169474 RepID=A0A0G4I2D1_9ALVE|eukprot:Cvel_10360.t1-p1 / transcript=Cvel_10360.t1 / gene=Cvel_10360 / organism=Chromera_velia_CCMP2878 / gene_product=hypothetical protein / transcript_product=hypothetical protein / location=Cvel_scaffold623:10168-15083(+) / protein_length=814 / sequence_SO=supercontig / SO=protein_coding / is_pseudo=false
MSLRVFGSCAFALLFSYTDAKPVAASCPFGYTPDGLDCIRRVYEPVVVSTEVTTQTVPAEKTCPPGSSLTGKSCLQSVKLDRVVQRSFDEVAEAVCPKGSVSDGHGLCTRQITQTTVVAEQKAVADLSTVAERRPYSVEVEKAVSVPGSPVCPRWSVARKNTCGVEAEGVEWIPQTVEETVTVPVTEKKETRACPKGTYGDGVQCAVRVPVQAVESLQHERGVEIPELQSFSEEVALPKTVLESALECPKGSMRTPDGTSCFVTLTRSKIEYYDVVRDYDVPTVEQLPQTLRIAKTELVPSYSCPEGSRPSGSAQSLKTLTCTVVVPVAQAATAGRARVVRVPRLVKRAVEVPVTRVESVPVSYCPKGSEPTRKGMCEVTVVVRTAKQVMETVTQCPPGSVKSDSGKKGENCKTKKLITIPATVVPAPTKKGPPIYDCPSTTTPLGPPAPGLLCGAETEEHVPFETIQVARVVYEPSTLKELLAPLVRYETREVTETSVTERVETVYDEITLQETDAVLAEQAPGEYTVPPLVSYSPVTTYEEVSVTNTKIARVPCVRPGSGGGRAKGKKGGKEECLAERRFRVISEEYTESVAPVPVYAVRRAADAAVAEGVRIVPRPAALIETSHHVTEDYTIENFSPNTHVEFRTVGVPEKVATRKYVGSPVVLSETVPSIPTYQTVVEKEASTTEKVHVVAGVSTQSALFETVLTETPVNVQVQVLPEIVNKRIPVEVAVCPQGSQETAKGCLAEQRVPAVDVCPAGSQLTGAGVCVISVEEQTVSCPKGFTHIGASSQCVKEERVPMVAASRPSKKSGY